MPGLVARSIAGEDAALALNGLGSDVIQRGIANAYYAEISGVRPHPQLLK